MKKVVILLCLLLIFNTTFSFTRDKLGIKYIYLCTECEEFSENICLPHKEKSFKMHLLKNINILLTEFKKNEPRALYNYNNPNNRFFMEGIIKSLDSGIFDNEYIIRFENGTDIYVNKKEKERYFELNKGDYVLVFADSPTMSFENLTFKNGHILENEFHETLNKIFSE